MSVYGLQVWDALGNPVIDSTTWTGLVLGNISLGANHSSGSVTDAALTKGRPFYFTLPAEGLSGTTAGGNPAQISVSVSGSVLSWTAAPAACQIIYGIY